MCECLCVLATEGGRDQTCSVCACVTCALVCIVHTISYMQKASRGEVAAVLYLLGCIGVSVCEVFVTLSRHFLIHQTMFWNEMKESGGRYGCNIWRDSEKSHWSCEVNAKITYWFNMTRWNFCVNWNVSTGQESNEARFCEHRCWQTRKSALKKMCPRIPLVLLYFAVN